MHTYLRAIGFSEIVNYTQEVDLVKEAIKSSHMKIEMNDTNQNRILQYFTFFPEQQNRIGLSVVALANPTDNTKMTDHIFPVNIGSISSKQTDLQIEPRSDKIAYSGISDDVDYGITLIYAVQNILQCHTKVLIKEKVRLPMQVQFGALSIQGRILCGVQLNTNAFPDEKQPISTLERKRLLEKARTGDKDAMEILTLDEMDTYSLISKRIKEEDLYTVVETYLMPYGVDNEKYSILGIIKKFRKITNDFSGEIVYNLTVQCNEVLMDVAINALDLEGEPMIGRRFRGIIWLQGWLKF